MSKESAKSAAAPAEPDSEPQAAQHVATLESSGAAQNDAKPAEDSAQAEEQFRAGAWAGHPLFQCPYCQFNFATDKEGEGPAKILQHIRTRHTLVSVSTVMGPDGKPIVKLEKR